MPALGNFVTTITQDRFIPKVVDNVLNGNVLTMRLMRNPKVWRGGTSIEVPVNLSAYTNLGSYSGFDAFATTQQSTRQRATFTPSQVYCSIIVSGIQHAVNQGEAAQVDVVAAELEQRTRDLKDELGNQIYSDGTGNSSKDFLGIHAAVDDSTNVTTYGGLSRSTYTNWRGTLTAQSGSLTLANLAADFDAAQRGDDAPTLIVTTPGVFTIYEALLTPTVSHQFSMNDFRLTEDGVARVGGTLAANQGFRALTFRGIPVVADEKCTSQNIFTLNEKHLSFYTIPQTLPGRRLVSSGFYATDWKEPANQDAVVMELLYYGQLITDAPRTHARRTGVSS